MKEKSASTAANNYNGIQALRFVAAIMVVVLHSTFYTHDRLDPLMPMYGLGTNGVQLFFVISGFVMAVSSAKFQDGADGWKAFAVKRLIRIVPLYWIATTIKLAIMLTSKDLVKHARLDVVYILKSYLFMPAINVDSEIKPLLGVGWTLNYEMLFYILFTLSLIIKVRPVIFCSIVFIPLGLLSFFANDTWPIITQFLCNSIILDFIYGLIAGALVTNASPPPAWLAAVLLAGGLSYLFVPELQFLTGKSSNLSYGVAAFLAIYGISSLEFRIGDKIPSLVLLGGAASYSLYLAHPLIAPVAPTIFAKLHLHEPYLAVLASILLALASCWIVYKFVEKPVSKLLSKWEIGRFPV